MDEIELAETKRLINPDNRELFILLEQCLIALEEMVVLNALLTSKTLPESITVQRFIYSEITNQVREIVSIICDTIQDPNGASNG